MDKPPDCYNGKWWSGGSLINYFHGPYNGTGDDASETEEIKSLTDVKQKA